MVQRVALSLLLGVAAMFVTVMFSAAIGLHHTWFPGGVVALMSVSASNFLLLERKR